MKSFTIILCLLLSTSLYANEEKMKQIVEIKPSLRQLKWQKLEFTGFFHFGINTFTDREWGDGKEDPKLFNPSRLDCKQWIRTAKTAGIRLAIITAKHHDGFCLWPSKYTDHCVKSSPWKGGRGDVVGEFVSACRANGIKVGIYLSPWDRHEPTYGTAEYNTFFINQLKEVSERYGPIDEFWFDGACGEGPNGKKQEYAWSAYYATIRKLEPGAVIAVSGPDVRWVGNEGGFARESEWSAVPITGNMNELVRKEFAVYNFEGVKPEEMEKLQAVKPIIDGQAKDLGSTAKMLSANEWAWFPAECDTSIRPGWFYHKSQDGQVKSLDTLIDIYFKSIGRNSVLLLNIPPNRDGQLADADVKRLAEFGNFISRTFSRTAGRRQDNVISFTPNATFDVISVGEDIETVGQRVEAFHVEAQIGNEWKTIASSTTIGYKRLIRLDQPVTARGIRLVIDKTRAPTKISSFSVHRLQK